eukprot:Gregarina_sp_Poly_1__1913@NODE_14_length_23033_cov_86_212880_g12_i0_p4_GENE_NODE_14_length_23033_cov_86_212880_g12_i0NODE_14_length_23033_cov_86_212880_g12_i0_p4_ORF_typecomplete_len489_score44_87RTC/PF01137_21/1_7e75RTC_insert/PF05189_13/8_5e27_NODE_14_length_23033_cov_86_212880_g12_i01768319149
MEEPLAFRGSKAFRYRLALSCLSGRPIRIEDIRLRDLDSPGLRRYEASLLMLLDVIGNGMDIKTSSDYTDVTLYPGLLIGGEELVFECNTERGIPYYLEFLMMLGPFCKNGLNISLRGVTDHPDDLSIEAVRTVIVGLATKIGLSGVTINIHKRGMLPKGGGEITFTCDPLKILKPFQITYAGRVKRVRGTTWMCHMSPLFARRCYDSARRILNDLLPDVWVYTDMCTGQKAGDSHGFGICLVAETMKQCLYSADGLVDKSGYKGRDAIDWRKKPSAARMPERVVAQQPIEKLLADMKNDSSNSASEEEDAAGETSSVTLAEALGERVACHLLAEIAEGGIADRSFQWLPILYMALADEYAPSRVRARYSVCTYVDVIQIVVGSLAPTAVELLRHLDSFFNLRFSIEHFHEAAAKRRFKDAADAEADSLEHNTDVKSDITESQDKGEDEEPDVEIKEDCKKIEKMRIHDSIVMTCVGVGLANIARKTF